MRNVKYTDSVSFRCLEHLKETSLDINLIHAGREHCEPSHICTGERDEYIIHFVISGKGFYSLENGNMYTLSGGQMFLIQPGELITYGSDAIDPWHYAWIGFSGIRADSILKKCGFTNKKPVLSSPVEPEAVMECIDNILECKSLTYVHELRREAWMLMLFSRLVDSNDKLNNKHLPESNSYSAKVYVELAIEHIKCFYSDGINVSDIAEHIGISRAYLNYAFQKELGMSIQKFLMDFRMHKAASLLVSSADSVKEISMSVGYEDQLTFSKAFKKKFGMSPKNYRLHNTVQVHYFEKQLTDHIEDFVPNTHPFQEQPNADSIRP